MAAHQQGHTQPRQSQGEFEELHGRLAHLGTSDALSALATITPERVVAAAREVRLGRTVTMTAPVETRTAPDSPHPADHRLTGPPEDEEHAHGLHFATDHFGMNVHGDADSHLAAPCHVVYDGTLHGGVPASTVTAEDATALSVELVRDGIVGRGVLLDVPRLGGVPGSNPATTSPPTTCGPASGTRASGSVRATCCSSGSAIAAGGRRPAPGTPRAAVPGCTRPRWSSSPSAGWPPSAATATTTPPRASPTPWTSPSHVLGVHALGLHLLDHLQFEDLVPLCEREGRWSFLCVIAPLRLPQATGSPVNPIAIL